MQSQVTKLDTQPSARLDAEMRSEYGASPPPRGVTLDDLQPHQLIGDDGNSLTNLIINYLPQTMQQEELKALFASCGEIETCKLVRDKTTGQSLGYGFVHFKDPEEARKAVQTLNGLRLQNKTIKVSFARPSSDNIKGANLYICGLPKTMTQPELEKLFDACGKIITSRILYDSNTGLSKGVGFIRFDTRGEAECAIQNLNGVIPSSGTEPMTVKYANQPSSAKAILPTLAWPFLATAGINSLGGMTTLPTMAGMNSMGTMGTMAGMGLGGMTGLDFSGMNAATMGAATAMSYPAISQMSMLSPTSLSLSQAAPRRVVGPIHTAATTKTNYRYSPLESANMFAGGLTLGQSGTAQQLMTPMQLLDTNLMQQQQLQQQQAQQQAQVQQQQVQQQAAQAQQVQQAAVAQDAAAATDLGGDPTSGWCLFVYNLGPETDDSLLWQLFGPYGAVQSVKLIKDHQLENGKCKGYGFVTMTNYDEAVMAIHALNGVALGNRVLQVSFKNNAQPAQRFK